MQHANTHKDLKTHDLKIDKAGKKKKSNAFGQKIKIKRVIGKHLSRQKKRKMNTYF